MEQAVADFIEKYGIGLYIPKVHVTDVIEVLILTFLIYQIIVWIKNTKAWMLLQGNYRSCRIYSSCSYI